MQTEDMLILQQKQWWGTVTQGDCRSECPKVKHSATTGGNEL